MAELEQESGDGKKFPKKLIIMIVAAIILVAVGGGVTFFLMKGDAGESEAAVHVEKLYFDMSKPIVVDFPKGAAVQHGRITVSMLVEGARNY